MLLFGFTREMPVNGLSDGNPPFFAFDDAPDTGGIAARKFFEARSEGVCLLFRNGDDQATAGLRIAEHLQTGVALPIVHAGGRDQGIDPSCGLFRPQGNQTVFGMFDYTVEQGHAFPVDLRGVPARSEDAV